jgi:hypothetical protein
MLAIFSLRLAISAAADQPQYAVVKERAILMRDALNKQVMSETAPQQKEEQKK